MLLTETEQVSALRTARYAHANRGMVHVIPISDPAQLAGYTTAIAENNRLRREPGA